MLPLFYSTYFMLDIFLKNGQTLLQCCMKRRQRWRKFLFSFSLLFYSLYSFRFLPFELFSLFLSRWLSIYCFPSRKSENTIIPLQSTLHHTQLQATSILLSAHKGKKKYEQGSWMRKEYTHTYHVYLHQGRKRAQGKLEKAEESEGRLLFISAISCAPSKNH